MSKTTILVIEDHKLMRQLWQLYLNSFPDLDVVAETKTAEEGIEKAVEIHPDIILLDINLPGMNGMDAILHIIRNSPRSKIIGISFHAHPSFAKKMIKQGASAYLTKNCSAEELLGCIRKVRDGEKYISAEIKDLLSKEIMFDSEKNTMELINSLSSRELEILKNIRNGCTSLEISKILEISLRTVEVHRFNILKKLRVRNTASLLNFINTNYIPI